MELILLIAIAILVTVLLVLALTKRQQSNASGTITDSPAPNKMQENRGGTEPQYPGTPHGNDADAQPEYAATSRRSAQNMMTTGELQRQKFDMMARQQETLINPPRTFG